MGSRSKKKGKQTVGPPKEAIGDRAAADICMKCGMCCDGTLFVGADISKSEIEHVTSLSFTVKYRVNGSVIFEQPCPAFAEGCCSAYEARPSVCRTYNCKLLPEYTSGRMSMDDCVDMIEVVRGLTRWMEEAMEIPLGSFSAAKLQSYLEEHPVEQWIGTNQALRAAAVRHAQLIAAYFGGTPMSEQILAASQRIKPGVDGRDALPAVTSRVDEADQ